MSHRLCLAVLTIVALMAFSAAQADIKVPAFVSGSNLNAFGGTGPDQLVNNSGMSAPVADGAPLSAAQSATHVFGGTFDSSWVTNANAPDYFAGGTAFPSFVWDLGSDLLVDRVVLWQYENSGGNFTNTGNHARTINLRFNTEAQGPVAFSGPATSVSMLALVGAGTLNAAQIFELGSPAARYVEMVVADNHYGDPDGLGVNPTVGGDRVGLGELRFDVSPVPEPSSATLLLMAGLAALARRRRT